MRWRSLPEVGMAVWLAPGREALSGLSSAGKPAPRGQKNAAEEHPLPDGEVDNPTTRGRKG